MSSATTARAPRMSGEQRREQILAAALAVFAAGGYDGTTTDQVARAAGVSQPYVVRLFGSKQQLFLELYRSVTDRVLEAVAAVEPGPDAAARVGRAYIDLMADRDLLRVLMHGFIAGDGEIGTQARRTLGEVFRMFRVQVADEVVQDPAEGEAAQEADEAARRFVADGMLINVLLAVDAFGHQGDDPGLDALLLCLGEEAIAAGVSR
jgi:AcrR family transcriptional regulator